MYKHIPVRKADILRVTNEFLHAEYSSYGALEEDILAAKAKLQKQWVGSLDQEGGPTNPDYSVYHDPKYIFECIHCFEKTKTCIGNAINYFHGRYAGNVVHGKMVNLVKNPELATIYSGPPVHELSVIDVYNGNGLTTVQLLLNGFNAESFNDCEPQLQYMQLAAEQLCARQVVNHTILPDARYDIVVSLEVLEHYSDPLIHVRDLVKLTKPGGYLVESSGFNSSAQNIGHFDTYEIDGVRTGFARARNITSKLLLQHYDKVYIGYGKMPRIWKRKEDPKVL